MYLISYSRKAEGKLQPDEMTDNDMPAEPVEGKLMITNIPPSMYEGSIKRKLEQYGTIRDFDVEQNLEGDEQAPKNKYIIIAKYPNVTEAEIALKALRKSSWAMQDDIIFTLTKVARNLEMEEYYKAGGDDPRDYVYNARFQDDMGMNPLISRGARSIWKNKRRRSTSRERRERRANGEIKMDLLEPFEQEKLKKLIEEYPDVGFVIVLHSY